MKLRKTEIWSSSLNSILKIVMLRNTGIYPVCDQILPIFNIVVQVSFTQCDISKDLSPQRDAVSSKQIATYILKLMHLSLKLLSFQWNALFCIVGVKLKFSRIFYNVDLWPLFAFRGFKLDKEDLVPNISSLSITWLIQKLFPTSSTFSCEPKQRRSKTLFFRNVVSE